VHSRIGLSAESTCNGRGVCGKCRVVAHGKLSPLDEVEREHLAGQSADVRLACRAKVLGDASATISDTWTQLQSVYGPKCREVTLDSPVKRISLPDKGRGLSPYADSLPFQIPILVFLTKSLPGMEIRTTHRYRVWARAPGHRFDQKPILGAAVDIGTTSLSLSVFDLDSGEFLGGSSALNPQTAYVVT